MARFVKITWLERDEEMIKWINKIKQESQASISASISSPSADSPVIELGHSSTSPSGNSVGGGYKYITLNTYALDDIDLEAGSSFETPESMIPWAGFLNFLGNIQSKVTGTSPEILNFMKLPTWQSTSPLKVKFSIALYSSVDARLDVLIPAMSLLSLTTLKAVTTKSGRKVYQVPGAFMGNMGDALKRLESTSNTNKPTNETDAAKEENDISKQLNNMNSLGQGRFVQLEIENLVKLDYCILEDVKPKFSKQMTNSGGPLWATVDLNFTTALPASSDVLMGIFKAQDDSKSYNTAPVNSGVVTKVFS